MSDRCPRIGGEAVAGSGDPIEVKNPDMTETIAEVASASAEQVNAAVAVIESSQLALVVKVAVRGRRLISGRAARTSPS